MRFSTVAVIASAGLAAASVPANQVEARDAQITAAPVVRRDILDDAKSKVDEVGDNIESHWDDANSKVDEIKSQAKDKVDDIKSHAEDWVSSADKWWSTADDSVKSIWDEAESKGDAWWSTAAPDVKSKISSHWDEVKSKGEEIKSKVVDYVSTVVENGSTVTKTVYEEATGVNPTDSAGNAEATGDDKKDDDDSAGFSVAHNSNAGMMAVALTLGATVFGMLIL